MIRLLHNLEKSRQFWFLLTTCILFFFLRFPSLIEPYWYGDEGVYQVVATALNNGWLLYRDIWDNKPPLLYILYAFFGGDQFSVRLTSLIVGLFCVSAFFFLAKKLLRKFKAVVFSTILFTVLLATPALEGNIANAENFILLPIIISALFVVSASIETKPSALFLTGLLLGIAFLFKVVAVFDAIAFMTFLFLHQLPENHRFTISYFKSFITRPPSFFLYFTGAFILPVFLTSLYFFFNNSLLEFIKASFLGNIGYVGHENEFFIPQGLSAIKLFFLGVFLFFLIKKRPAFTPAFFFILLWTGFSVFNAFFSQRPYTHYLLNILPSFCLLLGYLFVAGKKLRFMILITTIGITGLVIANFNFYALKKIIPYYANSISFITGAKDTSSYQAFFDKRTPRDYQLATFIKTHTNQSDSVFIWGDSPQIYTLSQKLPPFRYTVAYHIIQNGALDETQDMIDKKRPKYIIALSEAPALPFRLSLYNEKLSIHGATIYESIF